MTDAARDVDAAEARAIERFLYREARLLDERRFDEWRDLFAEDGVYWVPLKPEQTDPLRHASIIYDDRAAMATRFRRLAHPRAYAQIPPSRTVHVVTNVYVDAADPAKGEIDVLSALQVTEFHQGEQRHYAARCRHRLRKADGGYAIALKRVDLVNCDAPMPVISIPF
jgi:3-phenylpropionate/cinnamic acid dioxygenase small subunit